MESVIDGLQKKLDDAKKVNEEQKQQPNEDKKVDEQQQNSSQYAVILDLQNQLEALKT